MTPEAQKYLNELRLPIRPDVKTRAGMEPWVLGTEKPKQPVPTVMPTTPEERIAQAKAQQDFSNNYTPPKIVEGPIINNPVDDFKNIEMPFSFNNPLPKYEAAYNKGGFGGLTGAIIKQGVEGAKGALDKPAGNLPENITSGFSGNYNTPVPTPAPTTSPAEKPNIPGLPVGSSGFTVTGLNTSGRPSYTTRSYYDSKGNVVASGLSGATNRGGFVGASTDVEAARNLEDRLTQDKAASLMAANFDRQTEALKDLRAAQLGIPRSALEPGANAQPEPQTVNPFARPGDSFGDDVFRKNALESAITDPTATKKQRSDAVEMFKAYMEGAQKQQPQQPRLVNPLDEQRFLLAQQQAGRQQLMDENRLKIDAANLQNAQAKTALDQRQYEDKARADFMTNATFTAPDAPTAQLAATAWEISKATGVPPDVVASIVDEEAKQYDWKNGPPKDMKAFNERVAARVTAKYKGGQ